MGINENELKFAKLADPCIFGYVYFMPNDLLSCSANKEYCSPVWFLSYMCCCLL